MYSGPSKMRCILNVHTKKSKRKKIHFKYTRPMLSYCNGTRNKMPETLPAYLQHVFLEQLYKCSHAKTLCGGAYCVTIERDWMGHVPRDRTIECEHRKLGYVSSPSTRCNMNFKKAHNASITSPPRSFSFYQNGRY